MASGHVTQTAHIHILAVRRNAALIQISQHGLMIGRAQWVTAGMEVELALTSVLHGTPDSLYSEAAVVDPPALDPPGRALSPQDAR